MKTSVSSLFAALAVGAPLLAVAGCNNAPPPPPPPMTAPVRQTQPARPVGNIQTADPNKPVEGSALNKIFPPSQGDHKVVYTQEKRGFAQADVTQSGKKVAVLSISDTLTNPEARGKYASIAVQLAGYPSATIGSQGTAILVGDRFQVQVRSEGNALDAAGRAQWIQKFNLDALKRLAGGN